MRHLYAFLILLLLTRTANAQSNQPVCHEDVLIKIQEGCGEDVNDIDLENADSLEYEYILEGATIGKGTGSASGNFFNVGKTIVTYRYPDGTTICQFAVTVINRSLLELDQQQLDTIWLTCNREITYRPTIFEHCTGQHYSAQTEDPLVYNKKGTYAIAWYYYFGGEPVSKQQQIVVVSDEGADFVPHEYELPVDTIQCNGEVEAPYGFYGCSTEKLFATSADQTKFDKSGEYDILWVYRIEGEAIYRQQQHVSVVNNGRWVPDTSSFRPVSGYCSVKVTDTPFAKNNCSGAVIYGRTSDPLQYDKPGKYYVVWEFGTYGLRSGPIRDTQLVEVKYGGPIVPDSKALKTYQDSCSVTITDTPTALINCGTNRIKAMPRHPLTYTTPGKHTIEWVFTDDFKHTLVQKQDVIIVEGNRIVAEKRSLDTVRADCSLSLTETPFAKNRCTGERIKATTTDPLEYKAIGTYIIKWMYKDGGDQLTQEQVVVVQSKDSLIPVIAALPALTGNCEVVVSQSPKARNPCTGNIVTATTASPLKYSSPGFVFITWVYQDGTARLTQQQAVIVNETTVSLKVYPNPSNYEFHVLAQSCQQSEKLSLRVYDAIGRLIETRTNLTFNREIAFGADYPGTTYFAQVMWGDKQYMYKLVKNK